MVEYWYICDVNPVPWQIGPIGVRRNGSKMAAYVGRDMELHTYKEAIRDALNAQSPKKLDGAVNITCYFWRNRTEGTSTSGRKIKKSEADGTNMLKATEDACQYILFGNDRDNVTGRWVIVEQGPRVHGRVVIKVTQAARSHVVDALEELPRGLYIKLFSPPSIEEAVNAPNEILEADDEYANADPIF